jgi:hypothetical protein
MRTGPSAGGRRITVEYAVPVSVAFAYLADPRNRPEWQSSLRAVELLDDGPPRVGQRWRDLTAARIVPEMVITDLEPDVRWAETGRWRAFEADLVLDFHDGGTGDSGTVDGGRCRVEASFDVRARGVLRPAGWVATRAGFFAVRGDLRRAADVLAGRSG